MTIKDEQITINNYLYHTPEIEFGDYLLIQEYDYPYNDGNEKGKYKIQKPILIIFLGWFVADQTLGFNFVKWINPNHTYLLTNKYVTNYKAYKQVDRINYHVEWDDYIDILGHWKNKPAFNELRTAFKKANKNTEVFMSNLNLSK